MTLYLDSETGDVHHDEKLVGNAGDGPYLLEEDIIYTIVAEQLPNDSSPVKGADLKTILLLLHEEKEWARPNQS